MRKIITTTMITLDGVMQAPGGSKEDISEGFKYGSWERFKVVDSEITAAGVIFASYEQSKLLKKI